MSEVCLTDQEMTALYSLLKSREGRWVPALDQLLQRLERDLYSRMTIEEMDRISQTETARG